MSVPHSDDPNPAVLMADARAFGGPVPRLTPELGFHAYSFGSRHVPRCQALCAAQIPSRQKFPVALIAENRPAHAAAPFLRIAHCCTQLPHADCGALRTFQLRALLGVADLLGGEIAAVLNHKNTTKNCASQNDSAERLAYCVTNHRFVTSGPGAALACQGNYPNAFVTVRQSSTRCRG